MTWDYIITELTVIKDRLASILDDSGKRAVHVALKSLNDKWDAFTFLREQRKPKKTPVPPWELVISPGMPLSFVPSLVGTDVQHRLQVDLFCSISEPVDGVPTREHNIAIRVWSDDEQICFRDSLDSESIRKHIERGGRRVMLRFHFDHANTGQSGPKHHLQIGGKQHDGELCWLPDNWKLPRFVHHPLSLLTACEFVVRTFFPSKYVSLSKEPTWRGAISTAQDLFLRPYLEAFPFERRLRADGLSRSLLDSLWNQ